jgi:type VI secretion system protein ImpJ
MFLRPQHFQQFERFVGAQLEQRAGSLRAHGWGFASLAMDEGQLRSGRLALLRASGVFDDGTPFRFPEEALAPRALEVSRDMRDTIVHLCTPQIRAGGADVALDASARAETRFLAEEFEAADSVYGAPTRVPLSVARLQLSLRSDLDGLDGYLSIPVARIIERRSDDSVVLDDGFIPTAMSLSASQELLGFLTEMEGLLHQRGEAIAGRLATPGGKGIADITDFLLLISVNRAEAVMKHLGSLAPVHPVDFYGTLTALAAEISTMVAANNRPNFMPAYNHRQPRTCFDAVMNDLRRLLSAVFEQNAVAIPLELRSYGIRVGQIQDRSLFTTAQFVLAVRAGVDLETIRANLPRRIKVGSVEHIRDLVMKQLPGADVRPLPAEPRQIPFRANTVFFSINTRHEAWAAVQTSGAVALHVAGDIPNLEMEMWAIRDAQG